MGLGRQEESGEPEKGQLGAAGKLRENTCVHRGIVERGDRVPKPTSAFLLWRIGGRLWHLQGEEGVGWEETDNGTIARILLWTRDF